MIEVKNLTRKYGAYTAVNGVSFSIPKGQIIGLLGHNGAGKTTTLKMLTGYLEATSGDIRIGGQDIRTHRLEIQNRIGYLPENAPLYPEMPVVQYLEYVAKMRGIAEANLGDAIKAAIDATDLGPKAGEKIATLSKGYRQRVGVAQAIIHKPEILILDEPTNGLDPTQILAMRNLIKNLSKSATVILSTHIMQEVEAVCDRVLIILDGRLVMDSLLKDLQNANAITLVLQQDLATVSGVLKPLAGVKNVNLATPLQGFNQFVVEAKADDPALAAQIAKAVVEQGWNLYSLHREQKDLESIFREVNRGSKGVANV